MLQQTQIVTALPFYDRWMTRFPKLQTLAAASEQTVLSLWQGLGYYRRCQMLLRGAKEVAEKGFPSSRDEWLKVPGVGIYTANAIASICLQEAVAVVDGNVERVYARLACDASTGSKLKTNTQIWADKHLCRDQPGEWNQAVMELGATVCKPTQPQCLTCPISEACAAFQTNRVAQFPSPKVKPTIIKYEEEMLIPLFENEIGILAEHNLTWWKGMSLLPLASAFPHLTNEWIELLGKVNYTVTNHKITAVVSSHRFSKKPEGLSWVNREKIMEVPLPAPHRKAIQLLYKT
jgi:A/G-specific adenine glycosylase